MKFLLMQGDCLKEMDHIDDNCIDLVLTDPPYGIIGSKRCKWDITIDLKQMWEQLNRIIKNNGTIALFGGEPFSSNLITSNIDKFKYKWYWNKNNSSGFVHVKRKPFNIIEDIMIFGDRNRYYPIMDRRGKVRKKGFGGGNIFFTRKILPKRSNLYYPKNLINIGNANQKGKIHPTQKPVALMEYLIETYTEQGDLVLDFTMGSGTTGVACVNLDRDFIGIETDYFEVAKDRITKERLKQILNTKKIETISCKSALLDCRFE